MSLLIVPKCPDRYISLSLTPGIPSEIDLHKALARFKQAAGDSVDADSPALVNNLLAMRGLLRARNALRRLATRIREKIMEILRNIRFVFAS